MKKSVILSSLGLLALTLCLLFLVDGIAEAKGRMGGGGSFGSRPSYQRSAPSPAPSQPSLNKPAPGTAAPSALPGQGRWGGMLGGMLMGGLIGSMLFGGGMQGFGGPGLLDILLLGGGLFLLLRFLRSRRTPAESAAGSATPFHERSASPGWGTSAASAGFDPPQYAAPNIPADFDQADFLKGAKTIYNRMQASWDKRDLDDIHQFTSPEVFAEIRRQADEDPTPGRTEILRVNAELTEVKTLEGRIVASVLYDVMMRESAEEKEYKQVRELWHFSREAGDPKSFWVLEGIQQTE
jgi:predicted lipid-binding transport protein (Tim44 family)